MNTWRRHPDHKTETAAVKAALRAAHIPFRKVGHGTGTAWAWLEIYLGSPEAWNTYHLSALSVAKGVTGRRGDYDGDILILAQ